MLAPLMVREKQVATAQDIRLLMDLRFTTEAEAVVQVELVVLRLDLAVMAAVVMEERYNLMS